MFVVNQQSTMMMMTLSTCENCLSVIQVIYLFLFCSVYVVSNQYVFCV